MIIPHGAGRGADWLGQPPPTSGRGSCSASFTFIHRRAKTESLLRRDARLFAETGLAQLVFRVRFPSVTVTTLPARIAEILGEGGGVTDRRAIGCRTYD